MTKLALNQLFLLLYSARMALDCIIESKPNLGYSDAQPWRMAQLVVAILTVV